MLRIRDKDIVAARDELLAPSEGGRDRLPWEAELARGMPALWTMLRAPLAKEGGFIKGPPMEAILEYRRIRSAVAMVFGPVYYARGGSLPKITTDHVRASQLRAGDEDVLTRLARLHAGLAGQFRLAIDHWFPEQTVFRALIMMSIDLLLEALEKEGGKK